jgi:hypothetical protein
MSERFAEWISYNGVIDNIFLWLGFGAVFVVLAGAAMVKTSLAIAKTVARLMLFLLITALLLSWAWPWLSG